MFLQVAVSRKKGKVFLECCTKCGTFAVTMISQNEVISIGRITRLHGKHGELQCQLTNDLLYDATASFVVLCLDGLLVPFRLTEWREKGADCALLTLNGIESEQQALRLVDAEVYLLRKDCATGGSDDKDDLLAWQDLEGYRLFDANGKDMGTIISVDETTANILCQTDKDALFPLHEDLIVRLDTESKELMLNIAQT